MTSLFLQMLELKVPRARGFRATLSASFFCTNESRVRGALFIGREITVINCETLGVLF